MYERSIEREEAGSYLEPHIEWSHGDAAECHAEPPTCGCGDE